MRLRLYSILTLILCLSHMPCHAQINTEQVMRIGQNALYFEDYMLSIQYFNRVIEAKPYLARPYFMRSIAKLNLEDFSGAEADASKAIELNPFITDAYEVRGVARQNQGKYTEAIADYDFALSQLPENRNIMFNKALAQQENDDYEAARETFDEIITAHKSYDNAYVGRAQILLELGDTIAAKTDLDKAISLNKNSSNAYVLRANILISQSKDYQSALTDMDEAIKLQPKFAGYYINRAFLRYNLEDLRGAMADYDYAVTLDPLNTVAYFNRGLLRAEISDNDKAIQDFTRVLDIDPNDVRSLYNRSMLYKNAGNYQLAIYDINRVIEAFPEMSGPMFARFEIYDAMGDKRKAMKDYDTALTLSKAEIRKHDEMIAMQKQQAEDTKENSDRQTTPSVPVNSKNQEADSDIPQTSPSEIFANRFTTLLTIDNELTETQEFNNKNIRGRVQDRNVVIEIEPIFVISYYSSPTELAPSTYYMQDVDKVNATRQLRFLLQITNSEPALTDESEIERHFKSIDYYNSLLSVQTPRAIDYFGRGMDQFTLHNYEEAIQDFSKALELTPDFALAYFMRAVAMTRNTDVSAKAAENDSRFIPDTETQKANLRQIIADYDKVIELSPRSPFAYFNKANMMISLNDYAEALRLYSKAIEMKPDFGEAYYNRGYIHFRNGNRSDGISDLSRAGQMGILPAYNLLKRMTK